MPEKMEVKETKDMMYLEDGWNVRTVVTVSHKETRKARRLERGDA